MVSTCHLQKTSCGQTGMEITKVNVHQKSKLLSTKWLDITATSQFAHAQILYRNIAATLAIASHKHLTQAMVHDKTVNSANTLQKHKPQKCSWKTREVWYNSRQLATEPKLLWIHHPNPFKIECQRVFIFATYHLSTGYRIIGAC